MRWAGRLFFRLLHPPWAVLCLVPPLSFAALFVLFLRGDTRDAAAYAIYMLSAYSLVIWVLAAPKQFQRAAEAVRVSGTMQRIKRSAFGGRYLSDLAFHGSVGICQGMVVNFFYVVFRLAIVNVVRFRALGESRPVCGQGAESRVRADVAPRLADGDDRPVFGKRRGIPKADEHRYRQRGLCRCHRDRRLYAAAQPKT